MRLANELAALALEHVQRELHPGMTEAQAAAEWEGAVHALGTGFEGRGRERARVLARVVGAGHQDVHRHGQPSDRRARADAVRDLGQRRRLLVRPHEEPLPGRARSALRRARAATPRRVRPCGRALPPRRRTRRARPADPRRHRRGRIPGPAVAPDRARRRSARPRAAVRAPGRLRHDPRRNGARDRARHLLGGRRRPARRGQLADHRRRAREAVPLPRRDRRSRERPAGQALPRGSERARPRASSRAGTSACTTRRCATASRPSASRSIRSRSSRSRACSTRSASTGSRPAFRACRPTTRRAIA